MDTSTRTDGMRPDLERLGRFDEHRVRQRLRDSFSPQHTSVIVADGAFAGCVTVRSAADGRWLEHFYLMPSLQGRGLGSAVLRTLLDRIDASIGTIGDASDDALMESQIGLYKTELIKPGGPWRSLAEVELATAEWVGWFNTARTGTTPVQFRQSLRRKPSKMRWTGAHPTYRGPPHPGPPWRSSTAAW